MKKILTACSLMAFALLAVGGLPGARAESSDLERSGTIEISQTQIAFLFSGNLGGGKLHFGGKTYPFSIGGLGVGGIGASTIEATGEVYNLERLTDFEGAYGQARYGFAVGEQSAGELWLGNAEGVHIRVDAKRSGLALSLGADAIYLKLD